MSIDRAMYETLYSAVHTVLIERLLNENNTPSLSAWNNLINAHDAIAHEMQAEYDD